eukprot:1158489-Pelagomonas_calceolata.AAC.4
MWVSWSGVERSKPRNQSGRAKHSPAPAPMQKSMHTWQQREQWSDAGVMEWCEVLLATAA